MDIKEFTNELFGRLDVFTDENGDPWFLANAVAASLEYAVPRDAISRYVLKEDRKALKYKACRKNYDNLMYLWNKPNDFSDKILISESGLYDLMIHSRTGKAREFQHWITHTVLPSIRKNGGYIKGQEDLPPEEYQRLVFLITSLQDKVEGQNLKIAFLQKRRHELIASGKKLSLKMRKLKKEEKELNDLAEMYEREIASIQRDLEKYYPRSSGYKPAVTETTVVGPDGFVLSRKVG